MAGVRPPAIFILRQLTHLRALLRPGSVLAMAIAQRRSGTRNQRWRLVGQSSGRSRGQKNYDSNSMPGSVGWERHDS
jgi:hypothetical protein